MARVLFKNNSAKSSKGTESLTAAQVEEISKLAYQYFQERGQEHGHDFEDWLKAEAAIRSKKK